MDKVEQMAREAAAQAKEENRKLMEAQRQAREDAATEARDDDDGDGEDDRTDSGGE